MSLYAPKFGLNELGKPGERIVLKVILRSSAEILSPIFVNYVVGRKEAQVATRGLSTAEPVFEIQSVTRYGVREAVEDTNSLLRRIAASCRSILADKTIYLEMDKARLRVSVLDLYASAGKAYWIVECANKPFKIVIGESVEMYDAQRRRLVGIGYRDGRLILERAFQHPN